MNKSLNIKRLSIICIAFFTLTSKAQTVNISNYNLLKQITTSLPDSIYRLSGIERKKIEIAWEKFESNQLNIIEPIDNNIERDYNFQSYDLNKYGECCENFFNYCIDTINGLFKIKADFQLQIKLYGDCNDIIIGVSSNGPDAFASPEIIFTQFYKWNNGELFDYNTNIIKG